jgi:hypothetical protein
MAGATFGGKATSFPYEHVTGIEVQVGPMTGFIQIQSASYQGNLAGSYWARDTKRNPWELPNCIPIQRAAARKLEPHLAAIRERIAKGFWSDGIGEGEHRSARADTRTDAASVASLDLAGQLKQLAELHKAGVLTDEELAQAKRKLLG